jgi:enoyl-CoA hydratase/carnithine racemase
MESDILCQRDGAIATVTLFNPDKLNALNARMWSRLRETFAELAADENLRCVILRGEGAAFAAGGDLEEFKTARADVDSALAYHEAVGEALAAIESCPHPTVAAILGPCVGGGLEIACACDLRIAGEGEVRRADHEARLLDVSGRAGRPAAPGGAGAGEGDPARRPPAPRCRGLCQRAADTRRA